MQDILHIDAGKIISNLFKKLPTHNALKHTGIRSTTRQDQSYCPKYLLSLSGYFRIYPISFVTYVEERTFGVFSFSTTPRFRRTTTFCWPIRAGLRWATAVCAVLLRSTSTADWSTRPRRGCATTCNLKRETNVKFRKISKNTFVSRSAVTTRTRT